MAAENVESQKDAQRANLVPIATIPLVRRTMTTNSNNSNSFPGFLDTSGVNSTSSSPRSAPSPTAQHAASQVNGNGVHTWAAAPLPAGHESDLQYLYQGFLALSEQLKHNRELTNGIVRSAEEVMASLLFSSGRVRELEHELAKEKQKNALLKNEQAENTKLIGDYEEAVGKMVEQIRNYCTDDKLRFLSQARHFNNLLQKEKDEHLSSRLERDEWHAKTLRLCGMIRHAYRLRVDEEHDHFKVISGLQCEVRALRNAVGLEREQPEEETGFEYLKDMPLNLEGVEDT
ncbi:MAG: hypothetical protein Q9227_001500 [Pyrenula ochraceoflavens]